ncbi:MAG: zf-HC2 domain-containing protein [Candidatus Tectomicrobia bacterium]|uniref:Zf-HC2 domain-containing protein n=1 Tax=Tectimicrobiota bacterium TaxID=2528274 RepID=A0A932GPU7_UNCTE|nr:zf-HC2 domain-containing protein [Candidatus Tectomicrobia bacterium]
MFSLFRKLWSSLGCWLLATRGISCEALTRLLIDYVDGTMLGGDRARLDSHFTDCPNCFAMMRTYRQTIDLSREISCDSMPSEIRLRLKRFLNEKMWERYPPL